MAGENRLLGWSRPKPPLCCVLTVHLWPVLLVRDGSSEEKSQSQYWNSLGSPLPTIKLWGRNEMLTSMKCLLGIKSFKFHSLEMF